MLTQERVDEVLKKITTDILPGFHIPDRYLAKFSKNPVDQEFLTYVKGVGGSYVRVLPLLISQLSLKNIVELGNREGLSTLALYSALTPDSHFVTIDLEKDQRYCPDEMFKDPRVEFIFGDVSDLSIFKEKIPFDIDFLFTDTIHFDFQLRDEWSIYQHLLADRALVAIDDINLNDKRSLFDEVPYATWDLTPLCHASGWGLFLYERTKPLSKLERLEAVYKASAAIWKRKYDEQKKLVDSAHNKKISVRATAYIKERPWLLAVVRRVKKIFNP